MKTIYHVNIAAEELDLCERCIVAHCKRLEFSDWAFERRKCKDENAICQHCEIRRPRQRNPYREIRVTDDTAPNGVSNKLVIRIYKSNGAIEIREAGRRVSYSTTASSLYVRCVFGAVMKAKREKAAARKARRSAGR